MVWDVHVRNTAFQRLKVGKFGCNGITNLKQLHYALLLRKKYFSSFGTTVKLTAFIVVDRSD